MSAHMIKLLSTHDPSITAGHDQHTSQCKLPINIPTCSTNLRLHMPPSGTAKDLPNPDLDPRHEITIAFCNPCHCPAHGPGIVAEAELSRLGLAASHSHQLSCSLLACPAAVPPNWELTLDALGTCTQLRSYSFPISPVPP